MKKQAAQNEISALNNNLKNREKLQFYQRKVDERGPTFYKIICNNSKATRKGQYSSLIS